MNKVLKFLAKRRFNMIDSTAATLSSMHLARMDLLSAVLIIVVGCMLSVIVEEFANKDKP